MDKTNRTNCKTVDEAIRETEDLLKQLYELKKNQKLKLTSEDKRRMLFSKLYLTLIIFEVGKN